MNSLIKKIFYINLGKDIERNTIMIEQLGAVFPGVEYERFSAIDSSVVNQNYELNRLRTVGTYLCEVNGKFPKEGAIGCFLSHEAVLKKISSELDEGVQSSDLIYMVLEDDCIVANNFNEYFEFVLNIIKKYGIDWRILKPNCRKSCDSHLVAPGIYKTSMSRDLDYNYYFGAHMLIYDSKYIKDLALELSLCKIKDFDFIVNKELEGVFSFALPHEKFVFQSNLGGSNTTDGYPWSAKKG